MAATAVAVLVLNALVAAPVAQRVVAPTGVAPDPRPAHAAVVFTLTRLEPRDAMPPAEQFEGLLTLFPGGTGIISLAGGEPAQVSWGLVGGQISLERGAVRAASVTLSWDQVSLRLADSNRDGTLDTGSGTIEEAWLSWFRGGDHGDGASARVTIAAKPDAIPPRVDVGVAGHLWSNEPILPIDAPQVRISEPVLAETAVQRIHVLAGDRRVPGRLVPIEPVHGLASTFTFAPDAPLPLGAVLSAAVEGLGDPGGNGAVPGLTARVLPDVGSVLTNPGFERERPGWARAGSVTFAGTHAGIAPAVGARQAVLDGAARLVGYLDVPATATTLRLSVGAIKKSTGQSDVAASVTLHTGTQTLNVFYLRSRTDRQPAHVVTLDLTPLRGTRVYLVASTQDGNIWQSPSTMLLDDLSIR